MAGIVIPTESAHEAYKRGVREERERCARIADARAELWNDAVSADVHGDCAMSLAEECEDIAAAIRRSDA